MASQGPRGASKSARHFVLVRVSVQDEADHRICFGRLIPGRPRRHGQARYRDHAHAVCAPQRTAPIDRDRGRGWRIGQRQGWLRVCMGHGTMLHRSSEKRTGYREQSSSATNPAPRRELASIGQKSGQIIVNTSRGYVRVLSSRASGYVRRSGLIDEKDPPLWKKNSSFSVTSLTLGDARATL